MYLFRHDIINGKDINVILWILSLSMKNQKSKVVSGNILPQVTIFKKVTNERLKKTKVLMLIAYLPFRIKKIINNNKILISLYIILIF